MQKFDEFEPINEAEAKEKKAEVGKVYLLKINGADNFGQMIMKKDATALSPEKWREELIPGMPKSTGESLFIGKVTVTGRQWIQFEILANNGVKNLPESGVLRFDVKDFDPTGKEWEYISAAKPEKLIGKTYVFDEDNNSIKDVKGAATKPGGKQFKVIGFHFKQSVSAKKAVAILQSGDKYVTCPVDSLSGSSGGSLEENSGSEVAKMYSSKLDGADIKSDGDNFILRGWKIVSDDSYNTVEFEAGPFLLKKQATEALSAIKSSIEGKSLFKQSSLKVVQSDDIELSMSELVAFGKKNGVTASDVQPDKIK